jgi:hypothetical protein
MHSDFADLVKVSEAKATLNQELVQHKNNSDGHTPLLTLQEKESEDIIKIQVCISATLIWIVE